MSAPLTCTAACKNGDCKPRLPRWAGAVLWTAAAVWLVVGVLAAAAMALILVKGPGYTRDPGPAPTTPAPTTPAPTAPATPSPSTQPTAKPTAPDPTPTPSVGTPCNIFDPECPGSTGGSTGG